MIGPPSLSFKVGRSQWQTVTGGLFLGLGAVTTLGTLFSPQYFSFWAAASAALAWACAGLAFLNAWRNAPIGTLHWDGAHWHWADTADYSVQDIRVTMDFQRWVLVRSELAGAGAMWLWLEQGAASYGTWMALRRALVYAGGQRRPSVALAADGGVHP